MSYQGIPETHHLGSVPGPPEDNPSKITHFDTDIQITNLQDSGAKSGGSNLSSSHSPNDSYLSQSQTHQGENMPKVEALDRPIACENRRYIEELRGDG